MASRDEVLRNAIARIDQLEARVAELEINDDGWNAPFIEETEPMLPPINELAEENPNDQMAEEHVETNSFKLKDSDTVVIPVPTKDQLLVRTKFIEAEGLAHLRALPANEAESAYLKGGPIWLHAFDRDYVMSLPFEARAAMCQDIYMTDKVTAGEMARDILKLNSEEGQQEWAMTKAEQTYRASS